MVYALGTLLVIGLVLLIISFFMNSRFKEIETELEQLSMDHIQNQYVMNNKLKVLEEELLTGTINLGEYSSQHSKNDDLFKQKEPTVVKRVVGLFEDGYSFKEIEEQTGLSQDDIKVIVHQKTNKQAFA
ncbi:3-oxoacyl-[acyl-carrier-protein] synthase III [Alkalibacillus filiformis]|uniref:3-oxoacyl-[acyl-carrier-protein] synthase III n=1 Tax=Alkalibacillus filiformis TaxID=200990 RepID=A0ABU0DRR0_9BACI|nr:hypothetical protein [Alkalibacillus filiformis]MDQ0351024.1 3-oxoacyl-[acyl-carrier-protein] synthase III [Alkalibacillus filiformis]